MSEPSSRVRAGTPATDGDIRAALYATELVHDPACADSRVVPELGICQGEFRIDVAVVTRAALRGYEIKSGRDTLARLPSQAAAYSRVFDVVTLVSGASHLDAARAVVPPWWRILVAGEGCGGPALRVVREGTRNPAPDPLAVAQLLWRTELVAMLRDCGAPKPLLRRARWELWPALVEALSPDELGSRVRSALRQRQRWRAQPA